MKTILRTLLVAVGLLVSQHLFAATYYFSSSTGDDRRSLAEAQNPATPWRSIAKLNEIFSTLKPGDAVYFKRGERFVGTIHISASGTSTAPIVIGAYGSGAAPEISSLVGVQSWRSIGNGIFESSNTIDTDHLSVLLLNGEIQELGRYPNAGSGNGGYLQINRVSGSRSFTSKESIPSNFSGGEVVVRKVPWVTDRHPIIAQTGNTFSIGDPIDYHGSTQFNPEAEWGFIIQNHLQTLDSYGEWFFNRQNKKLYIYLGSTGYANQKIEVATYDHLVTKTYRSSYITFENVNFNGSRNDAMVLDGGNGMALRNIQILNAGRTALRALAVKGLEIHNSIIKNTLSSGIYMINGNTNVKIKNNHIENIGRFQGTMQSGEQTGIGIFVGDQGAEIENNKLLNIAFNGIHFRRDNILIKNNYIDGYCVHKTDGGGVYAFGGSSGTEHFTNRVISHNIILNGKGSNLGIGKPSTRPLANGIFMDDNVTDVHIHNNTIASAVNGGITLSNNFRVRIENNKLYDSGAQILIGNYSIGRNTREITIRNNELYVANPEQFAYIMNSHHDDIIQFGNFDNNKMIRPLGDDSYIQLNYRRNSQNTTEVMDLERWKQVMGKDKSSIQSPIKVKSFEVIKKIGSNIYPHGTFEANLVGVGAVDAQIAKVTGKILGSSLQVVSPGVSTMRLNTGAVKKDKHYVLRFKSLANKKGPLRVFLRYSGSPWQAISSSTTVTLSQNITEHEILFKPTVGIDNPTIMFISDVGNWTYWVDDVELVEAEVSITTPKDAIHFEYNATNAPVSTSLPGTYLSINNKEVKGSAEVPSYGSILLVRTFLPEPPRQLNPPTVTLFPLDGTDSITEGEIISVIAEAKSTQGSIKNVELVVGNKVVSASKESSAHFTIPELAVGPHAIWAIAHDDQGLLAYSDTLSLKVSARPAPPMGEKFEESFPGGFKKFINLGANIDLVFQDNDFEGETKSGIKMVNTSSFANKAAAPDLLFQSERWGSNMNISIPVPNGTYQVVTFHNELWFGKGGPTPQPRRRVYDISLENVKVKENFDIYVHSLNKPTALTFDNIIVSDGKLDLNLRSTINNASISGIAIIGNVSTIMPEVSPAINININLGEHNDVLLRGVKYLGEANSSGKISQSGTFKFADKNVDSLFHTERNGSRFNYSINLPNGTYQVETFHNELWFGKGGPSGTAGRRVFDISIEGKKVKENIDLFRESGNKPTSYLFDNVTITDGNLTIDFLAKVNNATVSGISIKSVSSVDATVITEEKQSFQILLNAGGEKDANLNGGVFQGETNSANFIVGSSGRFTLPQNGVNEIYHTERNGKSLKYRIPVPNGIYTLQTFHNELWFGKNGPASAPNRRVFDILVEGKTVRKSLDLYVENRNQPTVLTFNQVNVTDGYLDLELTASINNATISGIAVFQSKSSYAMGEANLIRGYREMESRVTDTPTQNSSAQSTVSVTVYPNPAKEYININYNLEIQPIAFLLYDMNGRLMRQIDPSESRDYNSYRFLVSDMKQGVYLLHIVAKDQSRTQHKIIINP